MVEELRTVRESVAFLRRENERLDAAAKAAAAAEQRMNAEVAPVKEQIRWDVDGVGWGHLLCSCCTKGGDSVCLLRTHADCV